jgi:hypothetical protein
MRMTALLPLHALLACVGLPSTVLMERIENIPLATFGEGAGCGWRLYFATFAPSVKGVFAIEHPGL